MQVNLTQSNIFRKDQLFSSVVEQNSVKFTSEKSVVNEEPPYKKNAIMKLDLSPLKTQTNEQPNKRKMLAEVLRILSTQMHKPSFYLAH